MPSRFTPRRPIAAALALPLLVAGAGRAAPAQPRPELQLAAARAWTDNAPLGDPSGAAVTLRQPLVGPLRLRLGAEWLGQRRMRTGMPCVGPIDTTACPAEPLEERSRVAGLGAALSADLLRGRRGQLELVAGVRGWRAAARTRGLRSDRRLSATATLIGPEVGFDATLLPAPGSALTILVGARAGRLSSTSDASAADRYAPFARAVALHRVHAGVAWAWTRRAR